MSIAEALILGIVQGLTEFLPVSSSGHLELGSVLLGTRSGDNLLFTVIVHSATALSTIVVFHKDILEIIKGLLKFERNESLDFTLKLVVSMIPILIVGLFFKEEVESYFTGNARFVAYMLLVTGVLLLISTYMPKKTGSVTFPKALIIGIAQTIAVLPGISRSGATISTALILGVDRNKATRFSFLMVLAPIIGASLLEVKDIIETPALARGVSAGALIAGFLAAFISGLFACKWMIWIVNKGRLIYFALYVILLALIVLIIL